MNCKYCNKYFDYLNDLGDPYYLDFHDEGYCSSSCMSEGMPQDKWIKYCIESLGLPDDWYYTEHDDCYTITIPKVYPFNRSK